MKYKKYWLGITNRVVAEGKEYYYAYVLPINECDNIMAKIGWDDKIVHVNIFDTKKKAFKVVEYWNECYKKNGAFYLE